MTVDDLLNSATLTDDEAPVVDDGSKIDDFLASHNDSLVDPDLSPERLSRNDDKVPLRFNSKPKNRNVDPKVIEQQQLISSSDPKTDLEVALYDELKRKDTQIERLSGEILKLKQFLSKRKQVYKRKRKDEGAPTRALSAYNIFVQDRFERLAKENEEALKSVDSDAKLVRVPPASLVASTGNEWKKLPPEEKARYEER
jgi:hypothetical protein